MRMHSSEYFFIGGSPLCGKSDVATYAMRHLVFREKSPNYLTTDGARRMAWAMYKGREEEEPELCRIHLDRATDTESEWLERARKTPEYWVNRQHPESTAVWRLGIRPYLDNNFDRGLSVLVEGVAALPQVLAEYEHPHRAVWIGNNAPASPEHRENALRSAKAVPDHWLIKLSPAQQDAYFDHVLPAYSDRYRQLVANSPPELGYRYFDLSQGNYQEVQRAAANYLVAASVHAVA